jgi:hypothetical protein
MLGGIRKEAILALQLAGGTEEGQTVNTACVPAGHLTNTYSLFCEKQKMRTESYWAWYSENSHLANRRKKLILRELSCEDVGWMGGTLSGSHDTHIATFGSEEPQVMLLESRSVESNGRNTICEVPFSCFLLPRYLSVCLRECM